MRLLSKFYKVHNYPASGREESLKIPCALKQDSERKNTAAAPQVHDEHYSTQTA